MNVQCDNLICTLPPGFVYAGSATFAGSTILDPVTNAPSATNYVLIFSQGYTVPANSSAALVFAAIPTNAVTAANVVTNRAVLGTYSSYGLIGTNQIDLSYSTTDIATPTNQVRVLLNPTATNDAYTVNQNTTLNIPAPGVLSNDDEPNGFTMTVASYTQPANGTLTVTNNGGFTYTPTANYNGSDSFTYTMTNGNGRASTATINLTVNFVNQAPTLNAIGNLTINENSGLQTINLGGIAASATASAAGSAILESNQSLTVTVSSSNPALIPIPAVNYTNPNSTGNLTFTPAPNSIGTALITVVVQDDGGTANGGMDSVTNSFNVTVLALTNIWGPGGSFTVNVNDATGTAGTGYTQTNYTGYLAVTATSTNPFTIPLNSFNGGSPGLAANFNNNSNFTWTIATTTRGVLDFDSAKFAVNTSGFTNDLAGGTFSVTTNGNNVVLVFNPNHAPTVYPVNLNRAWGTVLRIPISKVLTNYTSDLDNDLTALTGLGTSTNGTPISTNASYIFFTPTNNISESFTFTVRDVRSYRPGDTVRTATGWITITVTNAIGVMSFTSSGAAITLHLAGIPGYAYDVQRSTNLTTWTVVLTTNSPSRGLWNYTDSNPPQPAAYYRLQQH
jgi:hypothetical protein